MDQMVELALDYQSFARICKALGHPARIQIVEHLKTIDHCICGEIVQILPLAQSTVSQHLKVLKASGLIKGRSPYLLLFEQRQFRELQENRRVNLTPPASRPDLRGKR